MASKAASRHHFGGPILTFFSLILTMVLCSGSTLPAQTRATQARKSREPAGPAVPPVAEQPQVVAVINREELTRTQLANECIRRYGKQVLESEVNKHLILQECKKQDIKITAADVEVEVERMAAKFGFSVDRWLQMLQTERNVSPGQYRRDIVWPTLALRALAANQLEVTDKELKEAYEAEFGPAVQVRLIVSHSADRAQELLAQAQANPDQFDRLAKDHSEDENSAATRGLIPPIHRHVGDPRIEKAAFTLQPGQVSEIIPLANQYLILKCERHIPASRLDPKQREATLAELKDALSDRKLRSAASEKFRALQQRATVQVVLDDEELRKQMPGIAAIVNDRKITLQHLGEQCIQRYGEAVLDGEINRKLLVQAMKRRSIQVTQADLQDEIRRAAESYGFSDASGKPDVDGWLQKVTEEGDVTVDTYVRDAVWPSVALKKLVNGAIKITDEDLEKGFAANYGERVEILAIVLSSQRTAHEVFDLARKNPSEKFFGELANQYSVEPVSRANFGQVPPIRRFGGQPLMEEEAFRLKPGETSGVLAIGDKFIILRCLGRTKPVVEDMATVREELEADIREKKVRLAMSREFDRMKERAQIDNFLAGTSQPEGGVQRASYTKPKPESTKR